MRRLAVLLTAGLLVLTACGDDDGSSSSATEVTLDSGDASATVKGAFGEKPDVAVEGEYSVDETSVEVMSEGDGATVTETDTVRVDYHGVNGTTGEVFDSSFESGEPVEFALDGVIPGFSKGLVDQTIGSRVVISVTPDDGYGPEGNPQAGIEGTDTLIFVVDLVPEEEAPEATGTVDDVKVTGAPGTTPDVGFDTPLYVDETEAKVIEKGDGPTVKDGDTVLVDYHGVNGRTGEVFDSSFERGKPVKFSLDQVVAGFSKGLVGQTIGSRVVIAVTAQDGYPDGTPDGAIEAGDSIVFVVDLLDPKK